MNHHEILESLSSQTGIRLAFNESGLCRLRFDRQFIVDMEVSDDERSIYIYCSLGPLPDTEQGNALLRKMMRAHCLGRETQNTAFGLDNENVMAFMRFETAGADGQSLYSELEAFMDTVEHWNNELKNIS